MTDTQDHPYRILVTGSRDWDDAPAVSLALAQAVCGVPADRDVVIVHGGCPTGADAIAHAWGRKYGAVIDAHLADWAGHGKAAGPRRNAQMIAAGADVCLAFIRNGSRGASHTVRLARRAGIPVQLRTAP